ncbi:MAG: sporulation protein [Clostridia bacterium]|nr:sporulation protein [Clostridia bacterium]
MGIFEKVMAGMGIGAARVEITLEKQVYRLGEEIEGKLIIHSGGEDQTVDKVYLNLKMDAKQRSEHIVRSATTAQIADGFTIKANSPPREINFLYRLPYYIPVSSNRIQYTLKVGLDIKNALDPYVMQPVQIRPSLEMEAILEALKGLGFVHTPDSGELERDTQIFAFYPSGFMQGKLAELEILFNQNKTNLYLYLELDRKAKGLSWLFMKPLYLDDKHSRFTIPSTELVAGGRPSIERASRMVTAFIQQEFNKML